MSDDELRRFPASHRLLVHPAAGRTARQVSALTGASDWRRALVDAAGAATIGLVGTRVLPRAERWAWPDCSADELAATLGAHLPGLRVIGAAVPRQPGRRRLSLLARAAGTLLVVKLGADDRNASLRTEATVLDLLRVDPLPGIATPHVVAAGQLHDLPSSSGAGCDSSDGCESTDGSDESIEFIATTSLSVGAQRPAIDAPLRTFDNDLARRLATLPRPGSTPDDVVPVHGDLTPWNLRRTPRGLALFDWESAGWGAPGSDLATYRRACDEIRPVWKRRPGH